MRNRKKDNGREELSFFGKEGRGEVFKIIWLLNYAFLNKLLEGKYVERIDR